MKTFISLALLATVIGCGASMPTVQAAPPKGQFYRLYSDQTPCGSLCGRTTDGYWIVDQGPGTPLQFFDHVTVNADSVAEPGQWYQEFPNAILTQVNAVPPDLAPSATLAQGGP